jgi:hypothetical protein
MLPPRVPNALVLPDNHSWLVAKAYKKLLNLRTTKGPHETMVKGINVERLTGTNVTFALETEKEEDRLLLHERDG